VLYHYVGPRVKALIYMYGDIVMLVIAGFALYWLFETVAVSWEFGSVTDGLRVSKVWFLMAVPVGFALVVFRLLQSLKRDFSDLSAGRPVLEGNKMFD
jgi:C4-dicarboxylate transporter DctQ subunit